MELAPLHKLDPGTVITKILHQYHSRLYHDGQKKTTTISKLPSKYEVPKAIKVARHVVAEGEDRAGIDADKARDDAAFEALKAHIAERWENNFFIVDYENDKAPNDPPEAQYTHNTKQQYSQRSLRDRSRRQDPID